MLCPKCLRNLPDDAKFCSNCGRRFNPKKKQVSRWRRWLSVFFSAAMMFGCFYWLLSSNPNINTPGANAVGLYGAALVLTIVFLVVVLGFAALAKLFRPILRRPIGLVSFILVLVLGFGAILYFIGTKSLEESSLASLRGSLAGVVEMKMAGAGEASQAWAAAEKMAGLKVAKKFGSYQSVAVLWARAAARTAEKGDWQNLSTEPADFRLILSDKEAAEISSEAFTDIMNLKAAGDEAIKSSDRAAMRKVAAEIMVEKHWLNGVWHSESPKTAGILFKRALAAENLLKLEPIPEVGKGCPVETDPRSQNYGRCKDSSGQVNAENKTSLPKETGGQTGEQKPAGEKGELVKISFEDRIDFTRFEAYPPHTYGSALRKVCFTAYNGKEVCAPEASGVVDSVLQAANGFAGGMAEAAEEWARAWEGAERTAGLEPSAPTAVGGHEIPSDGAITQGEPDLPPKSVAPRPTAPVQVTPVPAKQAAQPDKKLAESWDGRYTDVGLTGLQVWDKGNCTGAGAAENEAQPGGFYLVVKNNIADINSAQKAIDPSGLVVFQDSGSDYAETITFQFYRSGGKAYAKGVRHSRWSYPGLDMEDTVCTFTVTAARLE